MKRLFGLALLAAAVTGTSGSADAVCAGSVLCAGTGCVGTVNVCPTATSCSGGVSVCPGAHPRDCHSSVDVCLNLRSAIACGTLLEPVCDLIPAR